MTVTSTVTLAWDSYEHQAYGTAAVLVTHRAPVPAGTDPAKLAHIPAFRTARVEDMPVALGDVPTPRFGWEESERDEIPLFVLPYAAQAVACPKCGQLAGEGCRSTGGGNRSAVSTHRPRTERVAGWTNAVQEHASLLAKAVSYHGYGRGELFAVFEAAAAPIPVKAAKKLTPKSVQLSEKQAEMVELAVQHEPTGVLYYPTGHLFGDHETRQTLNALESKGVIAQAGTEGCDRLMRLTVFGWQVYRQHSKIIHRLTAAQIDTAEQKAQDNR